MDIKPFESAALGVVKLVVHTAELENGEIKETQKTYHLVMDFNAMALAMEKTELDFTIAESWVKISLSNLLPVCWAAFHRFHPEVTVEEVGRMLSPAKLWDVKTMLMDLAYPGWTDRIVAAAEELKKQQEEGQAPIQGEAQPAAESA
ncbi:MAG TPA: hypothetical protein VGQ12_11205 [Candidatus Angelobacter sp.]|jgi:hypothetical protein|nr:hypothetical protein [Candidatus Angelobacter sp.]